MLKHKSSNIDQIMQKRNKKKSKSIQTQSPVTDFTGLDCFLRDMTLNNSILFLSFYDLLIQSEVNY